MKFYIGADLHARSISISVLDEKGKVISRQRFASRPKELLKAVRPFLPDVSVAVEAVGSYYWFVDTLLEEGIEVHLANALMIKAIAYAKVKTDRADAETIAQLLRIGMLPEAYVYPKTLRPVRDLLRRRELLVANRSLYYRHIQMLHQQMALPSPTRNVVKKFSEAELVERFDAEGTKVYLGSLSRLIDGYNEEIAVMERFLHLECRKDYRYTKLMEIPGIGKTLGQTILLESGDVNRFADHRQYVSYSRLVAGSCDSADSRKRGRNPKQGNRYLRSAYRNAAAFAVMHNPFLGAYFERRLKKVHKKAVVYSIIARKLAVGAYYVLRDGSDFEMEKAFGTMKKRRR